MEAVFSILGPASDVVSPSAHQGSIRKWMSVEFILWFLNSTELLSGFQRKSVMGRRPDTMTDYIEGKSKTREDLVS